MKLEEKYIRWAYTLVGVDINQYTVFLNNTKSDDFLSSLVIPTSTGAIEDYKKDDYLWNKIRVLYQKNSYIIHLSIEVHSTNDHYDDDEQLVSRGEALLCKKEYVDSLKQKILAFNNYCEDE